MCNLHMLLGSTAFCAQGEAASILGGLFSSRVYFKYAHEGLSGDNYYGFRELLACSEKSSTCANDYGFSPRLTDFQEPVSIGQQKLFGRIGGCNA